MPDSTTQPPIAMYWFRRGRGRRNFGDALSPIVVSALSGRKVRFAAREPRLVAIGSVLNDAKPGDQVWGTGFRDRRHCCPRGVRVHAVRGPLSRNRLAECGVECPEVYGDPALLLPFLFSVPDVPRMEIGVIPHYVDAKRLRGALRDPRVRVINICGDVTHVIREATRCKVLLSSSLHGCILGEAFGIPTAWVQISDRVLGAGFKFRDYYAATGRRPVWVDWRHGVDLGSAVDAAVRAPRPDLDIDELLLAFPYLDSAIQTPADLRFRVQMNC